MSEMPLPPEFEENDAEILPSGDDLLPPVMPNYPDALLATDDDAADDFFPVEAQPLGDTGSFQAQDLPPLEPPEPENIEDAVLEVPSEEPEAVASEDSDGDAPELDSEDEQDSEPQYQTTEALLAEQSDEIPVPEELPDDGGQVPSWLLAMTADQPGEPAFAAIADAPEEIVSADAESDVSNEAADDAESVEVELDPEPEPDVVEGATSVAPEIAMAASSSTEILRDQMIADIVPPDDEELGIVESVYETTIEEVVEAPLPLDLPEAPAAVPPPPVAAETITPDQQLDSGTHFGAGRCPRCGSTDFGKGEMITYGNQFRPAYYKPARLSFRRLRNLLRPFRALAEVEAQVCRSCGMMMLQVDTDNLESLEKRSGDRE